MTSVVPTMKSLKQTAKSSASQLALKNASTATAQARGSVSVKQATRAQRASFNVPAIASERCVLSIVNAATLIGKSDCQ